MLDVIDIAIMTICYQVYRMSQINLYAFIFASTQFLPTKAGWSE